MNGKKTGKAVNIMFYSSLIFYMVFLTWNILFKYDPPWELFSACRYFSRTLNLIPYKGSLNGRYFNSLDFYGNIILFIPMGIYLNYYTNNKKPLQNILKLAAVSFSLEALQYILAIGASDITDIINNTLGGIIGLAVCSALFKICRGRDKVKAVIGITSGLVMLLVLVLIVLLFMFNF